MRQARERARVSSQSMQAKDSVSTMSDYFAALVFGVFWSVPVALAAILLPRGKALGLMNGIALIAIWQPWD